ncbi:MAG TPA: 50S ribosomal protein L13 [Thermoplasmata archaeon]|nr:50S ribosomal protein L13 [Thermoplasmata archaeon]
MAVLDATDQVMGRLASIVAKRLLRGEEIHIVNAENALITGGRDALLAEYLVKRQMGSVASRMRGKGPYYPRRPDRLLHRVIRGMLPYQKPHGRAALRRLRVYVGVPTEVAGQPTERVEAASTVRTARFVRLGDLATRLGSRFS